MDDTVDFKFPYYRFHVAGPNDARLCGTDYRPDDAGSLLTGKHIVEYQNPRKPKQEGYIGTFTCKECKAHPDYPFYVLGALE